MKNGTTKNIDKSSFMKNVLILICSQIVIKILGLIYKLVIINIEGFGNTGNGYYSTGYNLYALLLTLSSIGIPSVISKLVSERLAIEDRSGAQRIFKVAMTFFVLIGTVLSFLLFFGADFIASNIYKAPDVKYVLKVLAPAIVFVSASSIFRGYFAGQDNMKPTSISQTLEQFLNCVLSITFVYMAIGKESYIMAAAGNLSTTLAVVITFIYLVTYYRRNKIVIQPNQIYLESNKSSKDILKLILSISLPITFGSIISVINPVLDSATVSNCIQYAYSGIITVADELSNKAMYLVGILSKVDTLVNLPLAINLAFSTALVPAIAGSIAKKDYDTAKKRISFSMFASIIIVIPCAVGFIVLAEPILKLIYPAASDGIGILQIMSIAMIFVALSQTLNGGLYGVNKMFTPVIALLIGATVKFILNIILIRNPNINIYGAAISSVVCQIIAFTISFVSLNKSIKLDIRFKRYIFKPISCGIIMGIITYLINIGLSNIVSESISTLISIFLGAAIYVIMIFMLKVLSKDDILMIPFGTNIYKLLIKVGLYKEELVK